MINVKIFRYDPSKDDKPRYQVYKVRLLQNMSVLGVLNYIYEELDSSLAYYASCRFGRCGGCTVLVNGAARLACLTPASEEMTIEPLPGYEVIKDLVVDFERRDEKKLLGERGRASLAREIEIRIGKTVAVATLLEKEAPKTCNAIWNVLPFESETHHAKIAGMELYFMAVPRIVIEEMENPVKVHDVPPGTVSYYPVRPYIQVFLGELVQVWNVDVNAFARITENLEGARMAARLAWVKPGERVVVRKKE